MNTAKAFQAKSNSSPHSVRTVGTLFSKSPNNFKLLMAEPLTVAAGIGWGMKAAGWIASPVISELFKKAYPYLGFDTSKKLKELETKILLLERVMEVVEESPHRDRLQQLFEDLKSSFYEAEEILDDVEYYRLKKQIKDSKMKASPRKRDWLKKKLQSAMPSSSLLKDQGVERGTITTKKVKSRSSTTKSTMMTGKNTTTMMTLRSEVSWTISTACG